MSVSPVLSQPFLPLYATRRPWLVQAVAVLVGTGILAVSSKVQVPMVPVPMTLQTLAVTLIGALYGFRLGTLTLLAWLAEAAVGTPVLAGSSAGLAYMEGPTGGYLASFVVTAAVLGWAAERGWLARSLAGSITLMVLANGLILVGGAAWLAHFIGTAAALAKGVAPFWLGGIVKAVLAASLVEVIGKSKHAVTRP